MKKRKGKAFKAILGAAAIATSLLIGMTAACATSNGDDNEDDNNSSSKLDTQVIKNGNFEFYDNGKGLYPISTPDNWSYSTNGNSSASMSGVIDTSKKGWDYITDSSLPDTLEANDDLESDDENKKNYNGALKDDMLYANPHEALKTEATAEDKSYIANPFTHKYALDDDGNVIDAEGNPVTTYADDDGKLYLDTDKKQPVETSVLMLHNYRSLSDYKGTESYYKSSTTVTLEASTACKISVWVKTDNLYFDGAENSRTEVKSERGAYIKLSTQVGGNGIDDVVIKNINTQQLLKTDDENAKPANNGWVQYTLYVEASTFSSTTVNVTLGLGESGVYSVEGYAFFDDLEYTKYKNTAEMLADNPDFDSQIKESDAANTNVTQPLAPNAETNFRVDKVTHQTNNPDGSLDPVVKEYNSADRHFLVDFTKSSTEPGSSWNLSESITAGLTVEKTSQGKFVSVIPDGENDYTITTKKLDNLGGANLPTALKTNGLSVKDDLITVVPVTDAADWKFKDGYKYNDELTKALKSAATLPGANGNTDAFVIVSADGAAYEAHITDNKFTLDDGQYTLVSFWMKPSEMKSGNAATVNVVDVDDEDNKSSFAVSASSITPVNIGDDKDIYDGWVQCFVRVANTSKENGKKFKIVVNFGNTTISGTSKNSYNAGWVALSNVSVMNLDEDVYGYTSGSSFSATLSFTEDTQKGSHVFDTADEGIHKEALAKPNKYNGYNGASLNIYADGSKEATEYDAANQNNFAGLVKKENLSTYIGSQSEHSAWLSKLLAINNISSDDPDLWTKLFDSYAIQPLLIVNSARTVNEKEQIFNYGYVGSSTSVAANGYLAASVRVKASRGAIANVYLVEDKENNRNLLNYELPEYTFWYDDDGNILKGEPKEDAKPDEKKENIAYTLRKDGLYENGDGKLYANLYNLSKYYDALWYENADFYDEDGKAVSYTVVKKNQGKDYFNADGSAFAPHHLIAGGEENNKIYEYAGRDDYGDYYYYIENEKPNKDKKVYAIDKNVATVRYESKTKDNTPYQFTIDTVKNPELADKWITVTFYVRTGVEAKNYRLELWSGSRDKETDYENAEKDSYVVFDYSGLGASLDESKYTAALEEYTKLVTDDYKSKLTEELESNDLTIAELEKLAEKANVTSKYDYTAKFYSFSLFDSTAFIPFNGETADENETGYSFNYSDYEESLAYLKIVNDSDVNNITFSSFVDYSVVDKDIEIIGAPEAPDDSSDDNTGDEETGDANFWLLLASIILVAAILLAAVAIFIRSVVLKRIRRKTAGKNSYNFNKNKRYVKKYVKANGEAPIIEEGEVDQSLLSDKPEEDTSAEEVESEAETTENGEEPAPAEESGETEAETKSEEEKSDDGNDKDADDGENK